MPKKITLTEQEIKEIKSWIHDYEKNKIHEADFCIAMKDDAYEILSKIKL